MDYILIKLRLEGNGMNIVTLGGKINSVLITEDNICGVIWFLVPTQYKLWTNLELLGLQKTARHIHILF